MAKRVLKLSKIRLDGNTQPRVELESSVVSEYQNAYEAGETLPPLEVMFDGTDYWLWDGFHRRFGADNAGLDKLPCNVTDGTREDAQWASYGANATHGLRRTNEDKAKAVRAALRHPEGAKRSDNDIAKHVGVSDKTVAKYRAETVPTSEIPKSTERIGADGRTINTANIGKKTKPPEPDQDDPLDFPDGPEPDLSEPDRPQILETGDDPADCEYNGQEMSFFEAFEQIWQDAPSMSRTAIRVYLIDHPE